VISLSTTVRYTSIYCPSELQGAAETTYYINFFANLQQHSSEIDRQTTVVNSTEHTIQ